MPASPSPPSRGGLAVWRLSTVAVLAVSLVFVALPVADAGEAVPRLSAADLGFDEIVFVKRKPYSSDHYYTDINNGTSPDRFLPENAISVFNVRTGEERPVVYGGPTAGRQRLHRQDQPFLRCEEGAVRFPRDAQLGIPRLGSRNRRQRPQAGVLSAGRRGREGGSLGKALAHR